MTKGNSSLLSGDSQAEASKGVERNIGRRLRTEADAANYSPVKPTLVRPQVRRENVQKVQNLATPLGVAGLGHHKPNEMF